MNKLYVLLSFLCSLYIVVCPNKTDVFYDAKYDIIFHNGKLYFPSKNLDGSIGGKNEHNSKDTHSDSNVNNNSHSIHEEEMVTGAKFWIYIFIILCKIYILKF